jgi:hypothetical protein
MQPQSPVADVDPTPRGAREGPPIFGAADEAEEAWIRRVLKAKDGLLHLTRGFEEDADALRPAIRPQDHGIYLVPRASWGERERRQHEDNQENLRNVRPFTRKWHLPFTWMINDDPACLLDRPFSSAPIILGSAMAESGVVDAPLPLVVITIDVSRNKADEMKKASDRFNEARARWRAPRDRVETERSLERLELMIEFGQLRRQGLSNREIANRKGTPHDENTVSRYLSDLQKIIDRKGYAELAPHTDPAWLLAPEEQ